MTPDFDPDDAAIVEAGVRALGWADTVSHTCVLTRDVVRTTGLVRDGKRFVMKQYPAATCLALLRERISILQQLARLGQPVPRVITAEPVGFASSGHAGWLIALEYLPGDPLNRLSVEDFVDLGTRVGQLHLRLREVGFRPAWNRHSVCSLQRCSPSPIPSDRPGDRLCHGDLHMGNVIRGSGGYAFIDFDEMMLGEQLYDVAALLCVPTLHRYREQALAVLRGYTGVVTDSGEADLVYGPKLMQALARRFRDLARIQRTPNGPIMLRLARDLAEYASGTDASLPDWLARSRSA